MQVKIKFIFKKRRKSFFTGYFKLVNVKLIVNNIYIGVEIINFKAL